MSAACQNCHGDGMCGRRHGGECGCECHHVFSKEWNDKDKLRLCVVLTHMFREDFASGRYGQPGRPNVQTLHELRETYLRMRVGEVVSAS